VHAELRVTAQAHAQAAAFAADPGRRLQAVGAEQGLRLVGRQSGASCGGVSPAWTSGSRVGVCINMSWVWRCSRR
jgi:hypothetical protein